MHNSQYIITIAKLLDTLHNSPPDSSDLLAKLRDLPFSYSPIQIAMSKMIYRVYVIELSKKVFSENAKFREANPQFNGVSECLYVGMTSKDPKERFEQHRTGYRNKKGHKLSSNIVQKYGKYLRPSLYMHIDPMTQEDALVMEKNLTLELRRQKYAVWFN